MSFPPTWARLELLKFGFESAVASTSVRARVCNGSDFGRESRACNADSFADCSAAARGGEGGVN